MPHQFLYNYALLLEYDGSQFLGFQSQSRGGTVQDELESAIQKIFDGKAFGRVSTSGRTDTGVHASGMVVSFRCNRYIQDSYGFLRGLNGLTQDGLGILSMIQVPQDFHARFSCTAREYEYRLYLSEFPRPLWNHSAIWVKDPLNIERMQNSLQSILGAHDFRSLAKVKTTEGKPTQREILEANLIYEKGFPDILRIRLKATGFLHNMIRILVGTLLEIGREKSQARDLKEILESKNRKVAGKTLAPHGLTFVHSYYENHPEIECLYSLPYRRWENLRKD